MSRPTRIEAEREHRQDLLAWAEAEAPELLPTDADDIEPDEWTRIFRAIDSAKYAADTAAWNAQHPTVPDTSMEEPF